MLRALPRARRRAVVRALREGRAVEDPRDAALVVAYARRLQAAWWPPWLLPRSRPRGRLAWLWSLHALWFAAALVWAAVVIRPWGSSILGWLFIAAVAYTLVFMPALLWMIVRMRWNAPEAERRNRELIDAAAGRGPSDAAGGPVAT